MSFRYDGSLWRFQYRHPASFHFIWTTGESLARLYSLTNCPHPRVMIFSKQNSLLNGQRQGYACSQSLVLSIRSTFIGRLGRCGCSLVLGRMHNGSSHSEFHYLRNSPVPFPCLLVREQQAVPVSNVTSSYLARKSLTFQSRLFGRMCFLPARPGEKSAN